MKTYGIVLLTLLFAQAASALITSVKVEDRGQYVAVRYFTVSPSGVVSGVESIECIRKSEVTMVSLTSREEGTLIISVRVFLRGRTDNAQPLYREYVFLGEATADARTMTNALAKAFFR